MKRIFLKIRRQLPFFIVTVVTFISSLTFSASILTPEEVWRQGTNWTVFVQSQLGINSINFLLDGLLEVDGKEYIKVWKDDSRWTGYAIRLEDNCLYIYSYAADMEAKYMDFNNWTNEKDVFIGGVETPYDKVDWKVFESSFKLSDGKLFQWDIETPECEIFNTNKDDIQVASAIGYITNAAPLYFFQNPGYSGNAVSFSYLAEMRDNDGKLLFRNPITKKSDLLPEGRIWEYDYVPGYDGESNTPVISQLHFTIDKKVSKYGKEYKVFRNLDSPDIYSAYFSKLPREFLLRQDYSRIYLLAYSDMINKGISGFDEIPEDFEVLLYDFDGDFESVINSSINTFHSGFYSCNIETLFWTHYQFWPVVEGEKMKPVNFYTKFPLNSSGTIMADLNFQAVEGIGIINNGIFTWFDGNLTGADREQSQCWQLNNVYDSEGNIIYKGLNRESDWFADSPKVIDYDESQPPVYFNLLGQKVMNPQPGMPLIKLSGSHRSKVIF